MIYGKEKDGALLIGAEDRLHAAYRFDMIKNLRQYAEISAYWRRFLTHHFKFS
jgi:hypothetical protein